MSLKTTLFLTMLSLLLPGCSSTNSNKSIVSGFDEPSVKWETFKPLSDAYFDKNIEEMRRLLSSGVDPDYVGTKDGYSLLHVAAEHGWNEAISLLLKYSKLVNHQAKDGKTPLHSVVKFGDYPDAIIILLAAGADPSVQDNDGLTAIDYAVENKHQEAISVLKKAMNPNKPLD